MEQIITLKVDLEYPDKAHHAIDEAVKAYEADKLKWTADENSEAKHLAMQIMVQLCLDGYSIEWFGSKNYLSLFVREYQQAEIDKKFVPLRFQNFNIWIAKCVCLCRATGKEVPAFIIKKAGECW